MKALTLILASVFVAALTAGCKTARPDSHELQLSVGDMQAIRDVMRTDSALPSDWVLNHAAYHMMRSGMEAARVWTNSLSVSLIDTNSLRGLEVTFERDHRGKWKRTELLRTVSQTTFVGDIPYDVGERIIETVLSLPTARSNALDYVQRIYAIPDDCPQRGPEVSSWMLQWETLPSASQYLVNVYSSRSFIKPSDDWDENEAYAEVFIKIEQGQVGIIRVDMLSPAIESTRHHGQWLAQLAFDLWSAPEADRTKADERLIRLVSGGCMSDSFADRLVRVSPFLRRRDANDGWGQPFRLAFQPARGTFKVHSAGPNRRFGDADDMERTWDFAALRERQLKEIAEQDKCTVPSKATPNASSDVR